MSSIKLVISSPPDRERVVVEGSWDGEQLFELSNEPSRRLVLEIYPRESGQAWSLPLGELLAALAKSQDELHYPQAQGEL